MFLIQLDSNNDVLSCLPLTAVAELPINTPLDASYMIHPMPATAGQHYDSELGQFLTASRRRWITKLAFRQRLTSTERVALKQAQLLPTRLAEETDTDYAVRCTLPMQLQDMDDLLTDATYIDLDRADTRQMVQSLEQLGLLAAGRAAVVLDDPIAPHEYFHEA